MFFSEKGKKKQAKMLLENCLRFEHLNLVMNYDNLSSSQLQTPGFDWFVEDAKSCAE